MGMETNSMRLCFMVAGIQLIVLHACGDTSLMCCNYD